MIRKKTHESALSHVSCRINPKDSLNGSRSSFLFGGMSSGKRANETTARQMTAGSSRVKILAGIVAGLLLTCTDITMCRRCAVEGVKEFNRSTQPFSIGFRVKKGDGENRYFWLNRVVIGIFSTNLKAKGDNITFATPSIEGTVNRRNNKIAKRDSGLEHLGDKIVKRRTSSWRWMRWRS